MTYVSFNYILAATIELTVDARVSLGRPARIAGTMEDSEPAEDAEVYDLYATHQGEDIEIDDIYIGSGDNQESLISILENMAVHKAVEDRWNES